MKHRSFSNFVLMAALIVSFALVLPAWAGVDGQPGDGIAVAFLDSPAEAAGATSEDTSPVVMTAVYMKGVLFAGPPLVPAATMAVNGKALSANRIEKSFITSSDYAKPPDISVSATGGHDRKNSGLYAYKCGPNVFTKAIGIRQPRSALLLI